MTSFFILFYKGVLFLEYNFIFEKMLGNTGITSEIQDYIANQVELQQLISGEYVRKGSGELFEANVKHLFPGDKEQAKLINPGSYIGSIIYDWISSYVGEPNENQDINYIDFYECLMTTGYLRFFQNPDTEKLEAVKGKVYYYDNILKKEYFVNLYEVINEKIFGKKVKYYLLVETFQEKQTSNKVKEGTLERKLFEIISPKNLSIGTEVGLETLPALKNLEKTLILDIDRLVIEKQVERPILEKVKTIIFSIEKKLSEIDKNFLDYTEQFKIFRGIKIPENCYTELPNGIRVVDFDDLGKIVQTNDIAGENGTIEIVRNTNDLLIKSIDYLDTQIRSISTVTSIPLYAFWIKLEGGNDSGTSKMKSAGIFYKKSEKYQRNMTKLFYKFWKNFKIPEKGQILEFQDIAETELSEVIDSQVTLVDAGLQSKVRAIMKIFDTDKEDAKKVLQEIKLEKAENSITS